MRQRTKPDWLRTRPPSGEVYTRVKSILRGEGLSTVCEEANCPNIFDCWGSGTATVMIMGDTCTRGCRFCAVKKGNPGGWLDPEEPERVARAVEQWQLKYVVLTSVDRDDLEDGGASHFAATIRAIKERNSGVIVEALIPDFGGNEDSVKDVVASRPEVIGHNLETVERLQSVVRDPRAGYQQSLHVLETVKETDPTILTKSSLMLGLGETKREVVETMRDLRSVGTDALTLGQYLQPTKKHLPVVEFISPADFACLRREGERLGFTYVASGPLVRSSYRAGEYYLRNVIESRGNLL